MVSMFSISLSKFFNFIFVMGISFILFTMFIGVQDIKHKDGFSKNKDITTLTSTTQIQKTSKISKVALQNSFFELQSLNLKIFFEYKNKLNSQDTIKKLNRPPIKLFS